MRTTLLLAVLLFVGLSADIPFGNELENTTWKGTFNIPEPTDGYFVFQKDTVRVMVNDYALETMLFATSGDTLSLKKVAGDSSCGTEEALYRFTISETGLTLKMLSDDCPDRYSGISKEEYIKQ